MKRKIVNTLIATSIVTGTLGGNTSLAFAEENNDFEIGHKEVNENLRTSHASIFPVKHSIMGGAAVSSDAFKSFLQAQKQSFGFEYKLTCSINEWVDTVYEEAKIEGVRADIVVAQAIKETGYFRFGGELSYKDNNFAGIGVTGASGAKESFPTARIGIRAQVQHLKAYGSSEPLKQNCVDPRFNLVTRGSAPSLEELAGRWAFPGYNKSQYGSLGDAAKFNATYGQEIYKIVEQAKAYEHDAPVNPEKPEVENPDTDVSKPEMPGLIAKGKVVNISSKLNVRSGAGTNHKVVSSLRNDQSINIYEKANGWYKIDYVVNGTTNYGYVSDKYIKVTENLEKPDTSVPDISTPETSTPENGLKQGKVVNISSRLNVRSGAGTNHSVVTTITNGAKLTINSEKSGWYNVTLENGRKGYVSSKYIKIVSSSSNDENGNIESVRRGKVTGVGTVLNVRSGASMSSKVVTYLRNNQEVEIIGESGTWYKIKSSKSSLAYVSKKYIKLA
ncbi:MAG: SH3 domain-containing protein [Sarcina sp.]